jgi:tripartite-type tricarboxylate transporter receptor subunit TctC
VQRDLQPVTIIGQTPMVLVAHKDVPGKDYPSLLAYIKAHPGELTFASNGRGSAGHLAGSLFKKMADANIRYIPYRTTPQATADLIGGRISMIWLSSLGNLAGSDQVKPIAVSLTGERWNQFPDVPTFDELGLKGYEATTWVSMYVTKDTPPEVAEKLTAAVNAALADPEVQKRFQGTGIVKPRQTGTVFLTKYLHDEIEKWGDILRTTKDTD